MPPPRTQGLIRAIYRRPLSLGQLAVMTDSNPIAVINTVQEARKAGFTIRAIPGPPTTFKFIPPETK